MSALIGPNETPPADSNAPPASGLILFPSMLVLAFGKKPAVSPLPLAHSMRDDT